MQPLPVFVYALIACVAVWMAALAVQRFRRPRERPEEARLARERESQKKRALESRTHVERPDGSLAPRCQVNTCEEPATVRRFRFRRNERVRDFIRRLFDGPSRFTVETDPWSEPEWCESHAPSVAQLFKGRGLTVESKRNGHILDAELELGHFERVGIYGQMNELAEQADLADPHRARRQRAAKVVPIARSR